MNRHLVTAIAPTGPQRRGAGARLVLAREWQLAGKPAPVAYAHDFGRDSNDIHPSGEGPG